MLQVYPMVEVKANLLMKRNIDALLKARGQTRKDLAQWCRRGESWISKIMKEDQREFPMKYFDRIADFFGLSTYQLLVPGLAGALERRKSSDRRAARDRRLGHAPTLNAMPTDLSNAEIGVIAKMRAVLVRDRAEFERLIDEVYRLHVRADARSREPTPAAPGSTPETAARPRLIPRRKKRRDDDAP